ncbi:hypothetical protein MetMK1DRAFT_00018430 [Metallosphaera yellowstonensis MK1]|jgi:hypothetical protein|uniref:Uncharacterized protein n=1 Tax=Metallosphaera yellowstonensis MK1 TaxID=671065 RepID=H2C5M0_9CREN|nr:hypothetical protein MetMK1DRAFT_00018430 [Metallosphaera yellowstonensis MK1]
MTYFQGGHFGYTGHRGRGRLPLLIPRKLTRRRHLRIAVIRFSLKRGGNKGEVTKLLLEVVVLGLMTFTPPLEEARFVIHFIRKTYNRIRIKYNFCGLKVLE